MFWAIGKQFFMDTVQNQLDLMQFAYRTFRAAEDATTILFNFLYKHVHGMKTHARLLFADFSSAFNTIQPPILSSKLVSNFNLDIPMVK